MACNCREFRAGSRNTLGAYANIPHSCSHFMRKRCCTGDFFRAIRIYFICYLCQGSVLLNLINLNSYIELVPFTTKVFRLIGFEACHCLVLLILPLFFVQILNSAQHRCHGLENWLLCAHPCKTCIRGKIRRGAQAGKPGDREVVVCSRLY